MFRFRRTASDARETAGGLEADAHPHAKRVSGRRVAHGLIAGVILCVVALTFLSRHRLLETHYLSILKTGEDADREEAAAWLVAHRSQRAIPLLVESAIEESRLAASRLRASRGAAPPCPIPPSLAECGHCASFYEWLCMDRAFFRDRSRNMGWASKALGGLGELADSQVFEAVLSGQVEIEPVIAELGISAVPRLVTLLKEGRLSQWALHMLFWIGPEAVDAVPALIQLLDERPELRRSTLMTLAAVGRGARAAESRLRDLVDDPHAEDGERCFALCALVEITGEIVVEHPEY